MNPIEIFVKCLAPHICLVCGREGAPLCMACMHADITVPLMHCYSCNIATQNSYVCQGCTRISGMHSLWVGASYAGVGKDLTKQLKFQRTKAAAAIMAHWLHLQLPSLHPSTIVCPLPTASGRVRARGYDQASLIAKSFAKRRRLPYKQLLNRTTSTRQVGASRHERMQQMQGAFVVNNPRIITNSRILLIDDVLTTGSTFESAAQSILSHDPKYVYAAAFAYQAKAGTFPSSTRTRS